MGAAREPAWLTKGGGLAAPVRYDEGGGYGFVCCGANRVSCVYFC